MNLIFMGYWKINSELYINLTEKSYERALELSEGFPEVKERIVRITSLETL